MGEVPYGTVRMSEAVSKRIAELKRERDEARQRAERAEALWHPVRKLVAAWSTYIEDGSDENYAAYEAVWQPVVALLFADNAPKTESNPPAGAALAADRPDEASGGRRGVRE